MTDQGLRHGWSCALLAALAPMGCGSDESGDRVPGTDAGVEAAADASTDGAAGGAGGQGGAGQAGSAGQTGVAGAGGMAGNAGASGAPTDAGPDVDASHPDAGNAGNGGGPTDAGSDVTDAATEDAPALPGHPVYCGDPPHGMMSIEVVDLTTIQSVVQDCSPVAHASVEIDLCPGLVATTYHQGFAALGAPHDQPFFLRLSHADYLPTLSQELRIEGPDGGVTGMGWLWMVPPWVKSVVLTPWQDGEAALVVLIRPPSTGSCGPEGVTVGVEGHPEAVVTYIESGAPVAGATATTDDGLALVTGLPTTGYVEVTASRPGCTYTPGCDDFGNHMTGRVRLEADWLSQVQLCGAE